MIYKIKVQLVSGVYYKNRVERVLEVAASLTLENLLMDILDSIDFDFDHMYEFYINDEVYEGAPFQHGNRKGKTKLYSLGLKKGDNFRLVYDFGDCWEFKLKIMDEIDAAGGKTRVVASKGIVEQYPDIDDEGWEDEYYDYDDDDEEEMDYPDELNYEMLSPQDICEMTDYDYHVSDELYDAAFQYKKVKPWKKFWSNELFAMRFSDGEIGYICIMGRLGDHCSLGLYVGDDAFESWRELSFGSSEDTYYDEHERVLKQNCIQLVFDTKDYLRDEEIDDVYQYTARKGIKLSGKNAFPHVQKFTPDHFPWKLDSLKEEKYLMEAAEAVTWIVKYLGKKAPYEIGIYEMQPDTERVMLIEKIKSEYDISKTVPVPKPEKIVYPSADELNDLDIKKLTKLKKGGILQCKIVRMTEPVLENRTDAPVFPVALIVVDKTTGFIFPPELVTDYEYKCNNMVNQLLNQIIQSNSKPSLFEVSDKRTECLLKKLSDRTGIKINMVDRLDELEDVVQQMLFEMDEDDSIESSYNDMMSLINYILELPDNERKNIPFELLETIKGAVQFGILPEDMVKRLEESGLV